MTPQNLDHAVALRRGGRMPIIGFGTWQMKGRPARAAVAHALAVGYRHLDTATVYENEAEVGRALAESGVSRDALFVTSKLPPTATSVRRTIEQSLSKLRLDALDLWLIHWPPSSGPSLQLYEEMLQVREEGLVRAVGVSNFDVGEIDELSRATGDPPEVNQIPWGPFLFDASLQAELTARQVALEGYSPLKTSDLGNQVLGDIAGAHGVSTAQVVLRWHIQHGVVVIPKSVKAERIAANFDVFSFDLDDETMARLDGLAGR